MSRKTIIISLIAIALLIGIWAFGNKPNNQSETVSQLLDAHGLAVDRKDSSKVYVATHTGLLVLRNDSELQRVGTAQDDYMGFSAHPTDASTFYTSGHPHSGGNIGFQKSTDGGKSWQRVSNGANGPVDFHAMAVSQADPNLIYGVYRGQLQRSGDEGKTWQVITTNISNIITLATNTVAKDVVYAGTTSGLYVSHNQGQNWLQLGTVTDAVVSIVVNPKNDKEMVASTQTQGLIRSTDGGSAWSKLDGYTGSMVMHLAHDVQDPVTLYLINQDLEIHKTTDSGATWKKIR